MMQGDWGGSGAKEGEEPVEEILRMEHITKRFGDVYANRDINLDVRS